MTADVYKKQILEAIPRLLSEMDRDQTSSSYGCLDREYWAWATKDFSNIDLQRGVYPLTLLFLNKFKDNIYFKNKKVLKWIIAGLNFWCEQQHSDGSFDHHYVNEHSYVGTSFTLYEIGETYFLLKDLLDVDFKEKLLNCIKKAGDFLVKHDELHGFISNHRAGTTCALYVTYKITGEEKYLEKANKYIESIEEKQSKDGWFHEYGGADPGYQTLDTFYLSCYHKLSGKKQILEMLRKSLKFLVYFVHPNGTIGGEYGSRNTELYYPNGFEYLSDKIPEANAIAERFRKSILDGAIHLTEMDIRNFVPFLTSYTLAFFDYKNIKKEIKLPYEYDFEKYFEDSQIFVKRNSNYYAILGISKGGVLKVYDIKENKLVYSNCGYVGKLKNNTLVSSQMLNYLDNVDISKNKIQFTTHFFKVPFRLMTPYKFLLFRIFNLTLGRFYRINNIIRNRLVVKQLVMPKNKIDVKLCRKIEFLEKSIKIEDTIINPKSRFKSFKAEEKFTTIYMASSKYYQKQDLTESKLPDKDYSEELNSNKELKIEHEIVL